MINEPVLPNAENLFAFIVKLQRYQRHGCFTGLWQRILMTTRLSIRVVKTRHKNCADERNGNGWNGRLWITNKTTDQTTCDESKTNDEALVVDAGVKLEDLLHTLLPKLTPLPCEWLLEKNKKSKSSLEEATYQVDESVSKSLIYFISIFPGQVSLPRWIKWVDVLFAVDLHLLVKTRVFLPMPEIHLPSDLTTGVCRRPRLNTW